VARLCLLSLSQLNPLVKDKPGVCSRDTRRCYLVAAIVPDRDGKDFVPSQVILDTTQNHMVAAVNRLTLISCLEELFSRVQVFGTELALAKYYQKEWPSEEMDQVIAEMKRVLN
jgi:hypothetical protein